MMSGNSNVLNSFEVLQSKFAILMNDYCCYLGPLNRTLSRSVSNNPHGHYPSMPGAGAVMTGQGSAGSGSELAGGGAKGPGGGSTTPGGDNSTFTVCKFFLH